MVSWSAVSRLLAAAERRERLLLTAIIAIVLVAGVIYSIHLGDRLRFADEIEYYTLAQNLVSRRAFTFDGVHPSAFRPPGYPFFLSLFLWLGAPIELLRLLNFVALGGCIYVTAAILRRRSGSLAGLLGAFLILWYAVLFYAAGTLYPQIVGSLLLLIALHLVFDSDGTSGAPYWLAGFLFGVLLLFIPSFVFTLLVTGAWAVVFRPRVRPARVAAMLLTATLVAGLWSVRNGRVFHEFVYGSANSGYMLLLGNSENASPNSGPNADISRYSGATGDDVQVDRYYRTRAIEYIRGHKMRVAGLYLLKVLNYFNFQNTLATRSEASSARDWVMLLTYGPLLALLLVRVVLLRRFPLSSFEALLVVLYVSNAFYAAIFFTRIRYRLPLDFLLVMVVASFLAQRVARGAPTRTSAAAR